MKQRITGFFASPTYWAWLVVALVLATQVSWSGPTETAHIMHFDEIREEAFAVQAMQLKSCWAVSGI